ncbi:MULTISPECIES: alpha-ketoglutarate-dependent dioxygenase AlkB family protein [Olivibacter]|uniref:Tail specific protease domain-containing protein n=1 Tax=Olivibacter jilunii TaxID=985016 RepID=A0ABW6BBF5_9SPHI
MQGKLFDDNRQLVLPRELMDYTPGFLERPEADTLLTFLLHNVPWQQTKVKMYDKEVPTPRLTHGTETAPYGRDLPALAVAGDSLYQVYANTLYDKITELDRHSPKHWVIDLRNNRGGVVWPMTTGLSKLPL